MLDNFISVETSQPKYVNFCGEGNKLKSSEIGESSNNIKRSLGKYPGGRDSAFPFLRQREGEEEKQNNM